MIPTSLTKCRSDLYESALETIGQNLVKPSPFPITLAHVEPQTDVLFINKVSTMAYKEWKDTIREYRIKQTTTEPYSPWQNHAELDVRAVKCGIWRFTRRQDHQKDLGAFLVSTYVL